MSRLQKIILTALAAFALISCSKMEINCGDDFRQIQFLTANYLTKADNATEFTGSGFGVYAWASNAPEAYYMDNEYVSKKVLASGETAWTASKTYYWPREATVDFISYYPRTSGESYITISKDKINYKNYNVMTDPTDIMYADKAVGYDLDGTYGVSAANGVPAFFHHSLARVGVKAAMAYGSKMVKEEDGSITTFRWEVRLNNASILGAETVGDLELTLSDHEATGLVPWDKPVTTRVIDGKEYYYNVWTPSKDTDVLMAGCVPQEGIQLRTLKRDEKGNVIDGWDDAVASTLVLPQMLDSAKHQIWFNLTVDTYMSKNGGPETHFMSENYTAKADLRIKNKVEAWQMNHSILYYIMVAPARGNGNGGHDPGNPNDPNYPVDPDDPNLQDAAISFDPAVDGWNDVNVTAAIVI